MSGWVLLFLTWYITTLGKRKDDIWRLNFNDFCYANVSLCFASIKVAFHNAGVLCKYYSYIKVQYCIFLFTAS